MIARRALAIMLGMVTLGTVAACGPSPAPGHTETLPACFAGQVGPVAIAVGARGNQAAPMLPPAAENIVQAAARAGYEISLFRADGDPSFVGAQAFASDAQNQPAFDADLSKFLGEVDGALTSPAVKAVVPEANPLEALARAAERVGAGGTVILLDSGLQTVAPLDFTQEGFIDSDAGPIVEFLADNDELPHTQGVGVVFAGLAEVASPQQSLNTPQRDMIKDLWQEIATKGGSDCVGELSGDPGKGFDDLPPVSLISIPSPVAAPTGTPRCDETTVLRDAGSVKFEPDKAEFVSPDDARATLAGFAETIVKENLTVHLTGTTSSAGDSEEGRISLSEERAEAVKAVLVSLGVSADQISTEGVGYRYDGYIQDRDADGNLLPGPAALNRNVIIRWDAPTCPGS